MLFLRRLSAAFIAATALLSASALLGANMLDDFEKLFDDVSVNYKAAIEAGSESRIADDYTKKMADLSEMADRIQMFVTKLQIEEVDLRQNVTKFKEGFIARLENKGRNTGKNMPMENSSGRWFPISQIKKNINDLRAMGFTTENGGSYKTKLAKKDGFDEFEDLLNNYARNVKDVSDNSSNNEWRLLFEKRIDRMEVLAKSIQVKLIREVPDVAKEVNFISEVNFLDSSYKDLLASYEKVRSQKEHDKNYSNRNSGSSNNNNNNSNRNKQYDIDTGKSKKISDVEKSMQDVNYTLSKIRKGVDKLKTMGFTLEGQMTRESKEKASSSAPSTDDSVSKDVAAMSAEELNGELQKERDRIYKANISMTGVSPVIVKYYVRTLSKSQKNTYAELLKKYTNRDYKGNEAESMAVREIHGKLKNGEVSDSKNELAKILETVRKDKDQFAKDLDKERYEELKK